MSVPAIIPFDFHSHSVRIVMVDGDPWFAASDVCKALGYDHVPHAMRLLDTDEKGVHKMDTLGGIQSVSIISESGMYCLVERSRKPEAKRFSRWVRKEVLPSIRKTGSYSHQSELEFEASDYHTHRKQMRERVSQYVNWAYDAREAMKEAGITPPEWPEDLDSGRELAMVVVGDLLRSHRWLLDFDHELRLRMTPVPLDAAIVRDDEIAHVIARHSFPRDHLPAVLTAAAHRLSGGVSAGQI